MKENQKSEEKVDWNELSLILIANSYYRNLLADEIKKEKEDIIASLERERKEQRAEYKLLRRLFTKQDSLLIFNQMIPKSFDTHLETSSSSQSRSS